jgi:hypothetical protein
MYGYETSCFTLKEEHRFRVFENSVLRRIFGLIRDWRKLHNDDVHNLYYSSDIIRMISQGGWDM